MGSWVIVYQTDASCYRHQVQVVQNFLLLLYGVYSNANIDI